MEKFQPLFLKGALALGIMFLIVGIGVNILPKKTASEVEIIASNDQKLKANSLIVDINGAVRIPGVYELPIDSRIGDLVNRAGWFKDDADFDWVAKYLNMAQPLTDGMKIYIPKKNEVSSNFPQIGASSVRDGQSQTSNFQTGQIAGMVSDKININTASQVELDSLPGIGPAFAQRIIDYRQVHNGFRSIEEIKLVSGIGEKTFEKIKDKITI